MKITIALATVLFNVAVLLQPAFAAKISSAPHQRFQNSLSNSIKYNRSPFKYNNPEGLILHGHKEKPRISKILKFQMEKILSDYEKHLSQGNMNRSHREQFKNKLRSKFNNIQTYSKDRLRKEHNDKSRRRRSRNHARRGS